MANLTGPQPATLADALQLLHESGMQAVAACRQLAETMREVAEQQRRDRDRPE